MEGSKAGATQWSVVFATKTLEDTRGRTGECLRSQANIPWQGGEAETTVMVVDVEVPAKG